MTTKISSLIARYIAENARLIVPNIGTLLRRKESGEIVFMEMLKKSDGTLNSIVAAHLNLTDVQANEVVDEYVAAIKHSLDADKKFIMDGVGVFLVGTNGCVKFIFNPSSHTIDTEEPMEMPTKTIVEPIAKSEPIVVEFDAEEQPAVKPAPIVESRPIAKEKPAVENKTIAEVTPAVENKPIAEKKATVVEKPIVENSRKVVENTEEDDFEEPGKERKTFDVSTIAAKFRTRTTSSSQRKRIKLDGITILAIVSGLIAICTLIWGMIPNHTPLDIDTPIEIVEE